MKDGQKKSAIMLIDCPDSSGIVATVTEFIYSNNGNILYLNQHVDIENKIFFMRVEWDLSNFTIPEIDIEATFKASIGQKYQMDSKVYFSNEVPKMAIFASKQPHCLYDILARVKSGEWKVEIPFIISNHEETKIIADSFGIDFHYYSVTKDNKNEIESKQINLLEKYGVDFIVLARYMQVLSDKFVSKFASKIINIHHSFLPAFPGAKPYHSAFERGVKIIGATSHYVTSDLDEGPIIEQDIVRVTHRDSIEDMIRKGRDIEKVVLSRAVYAHLSRKILPYGNKTIVFP